MPFVPAPNIIMTEVRQSLFGQHIESRIMVDNGGAVDATDVQEVAIDAWNWAETAYIGALSVNLHLDSVVTTDLSVAEGVQYTYAPDSTTDGLVTGDMLPNECALCVSLHTGTRGRSARGRWYVAGIPLSSMQDANNVDSAFATAMSTSLNALLTALTSGTRFPVIVSYITGGAPRVGGPVYFPITNATLTDTLIDSQKRRKPGVGS